MTDPGFDIIVYGATGFTGELVCRYLASRTSADRPVNWAMAGRDRAKLDRLRQSLGLSDLPLVVADAADAGSIKKMVSATKIVLTTVGPYQKYGTPLVQACAEAGTDYIDLCGEPLWMRRMIEEYEDAARRSGARILFSCGFDSIPSELGVWFCQQQAIKTFGKTMPRVRSRVREFVGGPSGGSVASGASQMQLVASDPALSAILADPFALTPGFSGPDHPSDQTYETESDIGAVGPFMLGPTDSKNVHRSNLLMGHPYGKDFMFDEKMVGAVPPSAPPPSPDQLPQPGEGPRLDLAAGRFDILFIGEDADRREVRVAVTGSRDPGYLTTSIMMSETALCLLADRALTGGIWTPGAAFRGDLVQRLEKYASMRFRVE
ncbi:saccharopine dehydrogenase NADP-binding domain-containing protein [Sphingorhabdus sp. YGSMI21]|uniref:saccharopine dehydrogenase family protein n=1 Tax=Sphingorhabdus sp. YGSMI21 TaxID=2077182 RepID=UPI000C1EB7D9|nr:saccharopine dehydrogenase NADP-binding domain-containing protein [Sphingorhabdus sp. YGSMI21]ATW03521.1 hypothetical protein CHN51_08215 [Sphingorhabdus sp. YGSMI21]